MHIKSKYNIYHQELSKQDEKRAFDMLYFPVSKRVQINYIFPDNVRLLFILQCLQRNNVCSKLLNLHIKGGNIGYVG